jgi:uncharacterized membrane protein YbhN (UPF0104 family)
MPTKLGDRVEASIERRTDTAEETTPTPSGGSLRRTIFWLAVTGVSLYLVFPSVVETLGSWERIERYSVGALLLMALLQVASNACLWDLLRTALRGPPWRPVIASQLAGNALSKIAPGGGTIGAAFQYRILVGAGQPGPATAGALTAVNLLVFAVSLALPVLALPALLRGSVDQTLLESAIAGLVLFAASGAVGAVLLTSDGTLRWVGRTAQKGRNALRRRSPPLTGLPSRLIRERDRILATLGPRWRRALLATVGRWTFDFMTLLVALGAIGSHPRAGLVLLAFCAAQLLAQIPVTPGGLGFVEAGLTAMLALAGVPAGDAVLATFAYRLFSYWLTLPFGLVGIALAPHGDRSSAPDEAGSPG